jgi:hypothetical protein
MGHKEVQWMNEKEKYRAVIEARLMKFGESLYEITNKMDRRKSNLPDIQIQPILRKNDDARIKLARLDNSDENDWQKIKSELDRLMADIDKDLRRALAYLG